MTVGASKAGPTITRQPALAPSPQPRPAPTARALPPKLVAQGGQNWTPIEGQIWKPIDTWSRLCESVQLSYPSVVVPAVSMSVGLTSRFHFQQRDTTRILGVRRRRTTGAKTGQNGPKMVRNKTGRKIYKWLI